MTHSAAPEPATDAELARRIAAGDQQAFVLLMRRHNQLLFRTARSILRDDRDAEDALQEAYLHAYRSIGQFRGDARLSTWLTRIVVNESIARARKRSRRAEVMQMYRGPETDTDNCEAGMDADATQSPELGAMRAQARRILEQSIDALPEAFRMVFVLRAVEEMTNEEVALVLDIPEATVRSRFFRARSQLRAALLHEVDLAFETVFSFDGERCNRIVAAVSERIASPPDPA
jgi:RNA polymerase sigma-70 factor (ECF subfamily)